LGSCYGSNHELTRKNTNKIGVYSCRLVVLYIKTGSLGQGMSGDPGNFELIQT
jgi:hypothetical protein